MATNSRQLRSTGEVVLGGILVATLLGDKNMKQNKIYFILISILIFVQFSCKDNPLEPYNIREKSIIGEVIDQAGNPVIGARVHYIFYLKKYVFFNEATIHYSLKSKQQVALNIYNSVNFLMAGCGWSTQSAGEYTFKISLANFTNGIYHYEVVGKSPLRKDIVGKGLFLILDENYNEVKYKPGLLETHRDGTFQLKYSDLGINKNYMMLIDNEVQEISIADSIRILLYKENYKPTVELLKINTGETIKKTFILQK